MKRNNSKKGTFTFCKKEKSPPWEMGAEKSYMIKKKIKNTKMLT